MDGWHLKCIGHSTAAGTCLFLLSKGISHSLTHLASPLILPSFLTLPNFIHRGNEAFSSQLYSQAESYYSRGLAALSPSPPSSLASHSSPSLLLSHPACRTAASLCHSNRAAARRMMGRVEEAVEDCEAAIGLDPCFVRAMQRGAR